MLKVIFIFIVFLGSFSISYAQSQYQYEPNKLTAEQQHLLEQVKQENAKNSRNKTLRTYQNEARNPAKYRKKDSYNQSRKSYR